MPDALDPDELVERYPRNPGPTLRVNFVASADGAVTLDGLSGGLSSPPDKEIFNTLRMVCDALIVGAGTVRAENYHALRLDEHSRSWRRDHGLPEFPLMVIVSGSLDLDPDQLVFADAPIRPTVITRAGTPVERRRAIAAIADVVTAGEGAIDLAKGIAHLHDRGATQLLCEGGPHLFGALIAADLVDELCLTVAPLLAGGSAGRIAAGLPGPSRPMSLRHALTSGDTLFLRYTRNI